MSSTVYLNLVLWAYLTAGTLCSSGHNHRTFNYNSPADHRGNYNFAYDTGSQDAHSMRMEYRDDYGIVRGRYGYTDPNGKLRMVEYEAGPEGFKARGDVGPDNFRHDEMPAKVVQKVSPLQLAGWDPQRNPMGVTGVEYEGLVATDDHPVKGSNVPRPVALVAPVPPPHHVEKSHKTPVAVAFTRSIDHPEKGYDAPRPVAIVAPIKSDYHVEKSIHAHQPITLVSQKHPHKTIHKPVAVVAPPRTEHIVEKSIHSSRPVALVTDHHPEKGYHAPARIVAPIKANHYIEKKHEPQPVVVVAQRNIDHPEKGYHAPKPMAIVHSPKLEHHVEKSIHAPPPVEVISQRKIEHHSDKGYHAPKPVAIVEPLIAEHRVDKSYHGPRPVALVAPKVIEHHPEKGHHVSKPAAVVLPPRSEHVVEKSIHKSEAVKSAPLVHSRVVDHHHHTSSKYGSTRTIVHAAPIVDKHGDNHHHHSRTYSAKSPVKSAPIIERRVEDHHHYSPKSKTIIEAAPIIQRRVVDHHHHPSHGSKKSVVQASPVIERHVDHHPHSPKHEAKTVVKAAPVVERVVQDHYPHSLKHGKTEVRPVRIIERVVGNDHHHHNRQSIVTHAEPIVERVDHSHDHEKHLSSRVIVRSEATVDHINDRPAKSVSKSAPIVIPREVIGHVHEDAEIIHKDPSHHGKKHVGHYSNRPATIHNIDVHPDEIRVAANAPETRTLTRVVADVPTSSRDVHVREHSSSSTSYRHGDHYHESVDSLSHSHSPRQVVFSRSGRGTFSFE